MAAPEPLPGLNALSIMQGPALARIMRATAEIAGLTVDDLRGTDKHQYIAWPRHVAIATCRKKTRCSLEQIGRAFRRDHTSVMNAIRVVEARMTPDVAAVMDEIARRAGFASAEDGRE